MAGCDRVAAAFESDGAGYDFFLATQFLLHAAETLADRFTHAAPLHEGDGFDDVVPSFKVLDRIFAEEFPALESALLFDGANSSLD